MRTASRESWPSRRKKRKNRGGEITRMRPRRSLFFVAPATPAGSTSCKPPAPATRLFRPFTNHESRNTAFMLFSLLSCALRRGMGRLWRGMGGAAVPRTGNTACWFSRIMHHRIYRRSVRLGCERVAQPKTAVRTAVPAARSRLPCSRLFKIVRHCSLLFTINLNAGGAEQVSAHRPPFSVGLPASAVLRSSRRSPLIAQTWERFLLRWQLACFSHHAARRSA